MIDRLAGIAKTTVGNVRPNNEDAFFWGNVDSPSVEEDCVLECELGSNSQIIAAVADGLGGHAAGEEASRMAIESIREFIDGISGDANAELLEGAMKHAHKKIVDSYESNPPNKGMATTYTGVYVDRNGAYLMHLGDSRCYVYRDGSLSQVSRDHSQVGEMVAAGELTEEEAMVHPFRSYVDRVLGSHNHARDPDIELLHLRDGDRWLLCTDGLTDSLYPSQIQALFARREKHSLKTLAKDLVESALEEAGLDNITLVLFETKRVVEAPV